MFDTLSTDTTGKLSSDFGQVKYLNTSILYFGNDCYKF